MQCHAWPDTHVVIHGNNDPYCHAQLCGKTLECFGSPATHVCRCKPMLQRLTARVQVLLSMRVMIISHTVLFAVNQYPLPWYYVDMLTYTIGNQCTLL
jgi:hypothetical protein